MFKKIFNFSGRANRKEYFKLSMLFIIGGVLCDFLLSLSLPNVMLPVWDFLVLLLFLLQIAVTTRRFHDFNFSGWWQFLIPSVLVFLFLRAFIMVGRIDYLISLPRGILLMQFAYMFFFTNLLLILLLLIPKGTPGPNKYGDPPKQ